MLFKINFAKLKKAGLVFGLFLILAGFGLAVWQFKIKHPPPNFSQKESQLQKKETLAQSKAKPKKYKLKIEKLKISAPIILNVPGANKTEYFKALEKGVAHLAGTPLPGEKGNSVIFGHSSFYRNAPGAYKTIFRNLNQLELGDKILVLVDSKALLFKVIEKRVVNPNDLSVLHQTKDSRLTLMTCWPPGRIDQRLIVVSTYIPK